MLETTVFSVLVSVPAFHAGDAGLSPALSGASRTGGVTLGGDLSYITWQKSWLCWLHFIEPLVVFIKLVHFICTSYGLVDL